MDMDEYENWEDDGWEDQDPKLEEAIRKLRRDYGPPESYEPYQPDGIIICVN